MDQLQQVLKNQILTAAKAAEEQLDAELEKLERLTEDDLEDIRRKRIEEMKKKQQKVQEWKMQGHGEYSEIPEEKEFFEVTKKSKNVVCQFYRDSFFRCKIVDKHLNILAKKHMETKFCKINAEKCPFLTERLKIKVLPTIVLVQDAKIKDYIVGFGDLGNNDEFTTEMLEWRIAKAAVIDYQGDLINPPDVSKAASKTKFLTKKTIRESNKYEDDDDDFE